MKTLKISAVLILSFGFFACGGSSEKEELEGMLEELRAELDQNVLDEETGLSLKTNNAFFDIKIPDRMDIMTDLNAEASLQYGYVKEMGLEVKEHYLIVLMETKEEIETYDLDVEFDAMSYSEISVESLGNGLDEYNILTTNPEVEKVNGMDCVKSQMQGTLFGPQGNINVYYKLGVFEGDKAFYQVLTWCIEEQKGEFEADMDMIIESFVEK